MPCRITIVDHGKNSDIKGEDTRNDVDKKEGLWLYTLNMDMMIKMGRKMPPEVLEKTMFVRQHYMEYDGSRSYWRLLVFRGPPFFSIK